MEPDNLDPAASARRALLDVLGGAGATPSQTIDVAIDLDEVALALSAVLRPGLDPVHWLVELDELAARCLVPTRDGIMAYLSEQGFGGVPPQRRRWHHSCLDRVLQMRTGLPITLAIVAIELGRRVGVELVGIGMPAHFLVGDPSDPDWFADPCNGGESLDRNGCRALLGRLIGDRLVWSDGLLAPVNKRQIVLRLLNNLKGDCSRVGHEIELARIMSIRAALPEFSHEQAELVRSLAVFN